MFSLRSGPESVRSIAKLTFTTGSKKLSSRQRVDLLIERIDARRKRAEILSRSRRKLSIHDDLRDGKAGAREINKPGAREVKKQIIISKNVLGKDDEQIQKITLKIDAVKKETSRTIIISQLEGLEIERKTPESTLAKTLSPEDASSSVHLKATADSSLQKQIANSYLAFENHKENYEVKLINNHETLQPPLNKDGEVEISVVEQSATISLPKKETEASSISTGNSNLTPLALRNNSSKKIIKALVPVTSNGINKPKESQETMQSDLTKVEKNQQLGVSPKPLLNSMLSSKELSHSLITTKKLSAAIVSIKDQKVNKTSKVVEKASYPKSTKLHQFMTNGLGKLMKSFIAMKDHRTTKISKVVEKTSYPKSMTNRLGKLTHSFVSLKDQRINKTSKVAERTSYPKATKPHRLVKNRLGKQITTLAYSKIYSLSENLDSKKVEKSTNMLNTFRSVSAEKVVISPASKMHNISISDVEQSKYPVSQDGLHNVSLTDNPRIKPACQIPKLDPFDKAALVHMKLMNKLACPRKYISSLQNGELLVKGINIVDAYFEYIKRPENDDNNVQYSSKIMITQGYKEGDLKVNSIGCLHHKVYGNIAIDSSTKASKSGQKHLIGVKDCDHNGFWFLSSHGTIQHYLRRLCISMNGKCRNESLCTVGLFTCSANSDKFKIGNGNIVHERTGTVLDIEENSGAKGTFEFTLVNATNANTRKWRMLAATLQNVDFRQKIEDDFLKVTIIKDGEIHEEYLAQVVEKKKIINRAKQSIKKAPLPYNVAFIMLDSQSKSNVIRKLPKIYDYLNKDKNTFIFDGQSIVGDGTTAQLSAMLAGALEWELPESRRGFAGARPIDNWPFIFKNLTSHGYVTFFSEDEALFGAFNYRLHGFTKPPVDHYPRPFWLASKLGYYFQGVCHGDVSIAKRSFDYAASFYDSYKGIPKFSLTVLSAMVHNDLNKVENVQDDLLALIKIMEKKGQLKDTFLIIFGDHGARLSEFRNTLTGKLEERLPFLSVTLPDKLVKKFPSIATAMEHNTKVLTSYFDIHATLQHLFTYPTQPDVSRGQSLFNKIDPRTRTCGTAGVKEHWCPCLQFTEENKTSEKIIKMAKTVVEFINKNITGIISEAKEKCAKFELHEVQRAGRKIPNEAVQRFKQTNQNSKCIECEVVFDNEASLDQHSIDYETVFSVKPGKGLFEASVTVTNDEIVVNREISRINRYGDQPKCIQDKYPLLRKYCYCRN